MSAFSSVSCLETSPNHYPLVLPFNTVNWPSTVPSAYELLPSFSSGLHSRLNCHGPPAPTAVAPLDYESFWPTVPSRGSYSVFSPLRSSLARSFEKPRKTYIGLIAEAILSSPEKKLVLSDIYSYILTRYPYFRTKGSGWRNSIRQNLSLNDCFIKAGRSWNGRGHFWTICPMYYEDFMHGDYCRKRARKVIKLDFKPTECFLSDSHHRHFACFSEEAKSRSNVPAQRTATLPRYEERDHDEVKVTDVHCVTIDQCSPEHDPGQKRSFDIQSLLSLQH